MTPEQETAEKEFQQECECFAAKTAITAAETMPLGKRVMIYRGILGLLPAGTEARTTAEAASIALETADRSQLRLFELLDTDS